MQLFAVIFADELDQEGRSAIQFNIRTPNPNFKHYAVAQSGRGAQAGTIRRLLAQVCPDYPQAYVEDAGRAVWVVREQPAPTDKTS